jgi:flavin reductase (DIM6/NTAB) family NADH-FMN oxidoreductase RutF
MKITTLTNPRQIILVTSRAKGKDNIITLDWHTPLSFEPMLYAICVGKNRFSLELIRKSKVFVVNFMAKDFEKEILFCGRNSGKEIDKFKETGFEKEESKIINCPRIKQALGYLECKVEKEIEAGDHILFLAKVLKSELKKKEKRLFHLFGDKFTTTLE